MNLTSEFRPKTQPAPVRPPKPLPTDPPPYSAHPRSSSEASLHSRSESEDETFHDARFPPEEEASLIAQSNTTKSEANTLFTAGHYGEAISTYDRALASCPNYLEYEIAVLKSNVAACHLKLEEWKQAVEAANVALDALERLDPFPKKEEHSKAQTISEDRTSDKKARPTQDTNDSIVELDDEEEEEAALEKLKMINARKIDIARIRAKTLLRRARARSSQDGWANLAGAEEDYRLLMTDARLSGILPASDMKVVKAGLRELPPKITQAKEQEMGEMMGKLKELGNGILKPFGLSTDNFNFIKDEKTGGYSMNFEQGAKK